ncbi:MAG: TolC family protein [Paludibacteraceae bacterium]|nr:TolC family protein [Paludibacteraceae bacterium]
MKKKLILFALCTLLLPLNTFAEDHVMAATKSQKQERETPKELNLTLKQARDYAVEQNRTLRNASLAVQQAYAQRWQTIAAMLPSVDANYSYSNYLGYSAELNTAMGSFKVDMPNVGTFSITAAVGVNGQGIVGALLQNIAIDMKKISLEQSEVELRGSVMTSYVSLLALQNISTLLDSSLVNIQELEQMTQNAVNVGAAEQTSADQIRVRVNSLKNNISAQQRNIELASNALKVLLDVPVETKLNLTDNLDDLLSPEAILQLMQEEYNINNNLNYQLLEKNTELAKKQIHLAAWAYGPTVSLAYQYSKQHYYGDGGMRMTPPNVVQIGVAIPLWSSGKRAATLVEKKIAYEEAKNTLSETKDQLDIQYQQLKYNLSTNYETYINMKENIEVTQRVFNSTANKFRWGTASNLELVNASNDLISAQSNYIQAVLSLVEAQVDLHTFLNNPN